MSDRDPIPDEQPSEANRVSGRFLSDFFGALERSGIPARGLLGDLPIRLGENGEVLAEVEWNHFADFMRRLEQHVEGPAGLERIGRSIGDLAPAAALRSLAGLAASPVALYRAASHWALRRAMPGVEARLEVVDVGHLEIHARLAKDLRPCPQIFHFATGGARALPRLIGLGDAVVSARIAPREAHYRIIIPPSLTLPARIKRFFRTIFSAGSVLHFLEAQQLELHAKNDELQRAHDELARSEARYRALVDTAVDVLCEIDESGQVVYASRSVHDLIGYAPEQVTGSHYRLWLPREYHARVSRRFATLAALPEGSATQDRLALHSANGTPVVVELTARVYDTPENERRIVCILRNRSARRPGIGAFREARASSARPKPARSSPRTEHPPAVLGDESCETRQWIETRKLLRSARDMFLAKPAALDFDVALDFEKAPSEVFAAESQLLLDLVQLLEASAAACRNDADRTEAGPDRRLVLSLCAGASSSRARSKTTYFEVAADLEGQRMRRVSERLALPQPDGR